MTGPHSASARAFEDRAFLLVVAVTTLAFAWILWPFSGAILWGVVIAVLFAPLHRRILRHMAKRPSLAAFLTMLIVLLIVILPLTFLSILLVDQAIGLYTRLQSGELDVAAYLQQIMGILPDWAVSLWNRYGPSNLAEVQERLSAFASAALRFLGQQAVNLGQYTIAFAISLFVMLYLLFFLFRDGETLAVRIKAAVPLRPELRESLAARFTTAVRATLKGTLLVALAQGALGGLIFWLLGIQAAVLWGALMAIMALLPAVGPAIVWIPAAIYLFVADSPWKGILLAVYGIVVIGLVDNLLRPMLVGRDMRMPDWVVLLATLGGIAIFGVNGFIIGPVIAALFIAVWEIFGSVQTEVAAAVVPNPGVVAAPEPPPAEAGRSP